MTASASPKEIHVPAIKNGTVIDHLPAGWGLRIIKLLGGAPRNKIVTLGLNLKSHEVGHKDLIKIEDRELTKGEVDHIALIASSATINIVRDYKVLHKIKPHLPPHITNIAPCPNPMCITNHERMSTVFHTRVEKKVITLACNYCEKEFSQEEVTSAL